MAELPITSWIISSLIPIPVWIFHKKGLPCGKMNPLIGYWTDRDLEPVLYELNKIPCDQFHVKYFSYPYPHKIIEDYFKIHREYTHLILIPNDLLFKLSNYLQLTSLI